MFPPAGAGKRLLRERDLGDQSADVAQTVLERGVEDGGVALGGSGPRAGRVTWPSMSDSLAGKC